jgi:hypothetical protein
MVMSKSMHVQFADGTSHTYDDIPDDVTQDQVNARAAEDFPSRKISGVNQGAHPEAAPVPPSEGAVAPTVGEKVMGGLQTGAQLAEEHPVLAGGAAYGAYNLGSKIPGVGPAISKAGNAIGETFVPKYNVIKNVSQGINNAANAYNINNLSKATEAISNLSEQINHAQSFGQDTSALERTREGLMKQLGLSQNAIAPTTPPVTPASTAINGGTAAANDGWIAKAIQSAKQYTAPVESAVSKVAPVLKGMSKLAIPAMIGSELFYTSPEEQKQLKELEAERRAKGWKPRNER